MIDFALNVNGDIDYIESNRKSENLQFNFLVADTNSLMLNFYYQDEPSDGLIPGLEPGLIFNMYVENIDYDKEICLTESDEDLLYQSIKIRLSSVKNTILNNENIGSTLDNYMHRLLNSDKETDDLEQIKNCIYEAIKDIAPSASINIQRIDTIYTDYSNSLIVAIYIKQYRYYYYL